MDRNLKIIVIVGIVIILVFGGLIINLMLENRDHEEHVVNDDGSETIYNTDDYIINQSTNLYVDSNAKLGDNSRVLAVLESINAENENVVLLNARETNGNLHEILVSDMKLMNINYNGIDEVNLTYRTGGSARVIVGSYLYLYKKADGTYSLDERSQHGGEYEIVTGTVTDFEFAPMQQQNGHIMLSYVVLDANGQSVKLPLSTMSVQSITSSGEMTVYYVGDNANDNIYSVRAGDNFSINVTMHDGSVMTFAKGGQINVQRSAKKGYWELEETIDATKVQASIADIEFGYDDNNVTGINYIVLALPDGTQEKMALMHTQALYGTPSGNYQRSYASDGTDMVISDVAPAADWKMTLNYNNGITLDLRVGSQVWIHKNSENIYVLDFEYTHMTLQSEE